MQAANQNKSWKNSMTNVKGTLKKSWDKTREIATSSPAKVAYSSAAVLLAGVIVKEFHGARKEKKQLKDAARKAKKTKPQQ